MAFKNNKKRSNYVNVAVSSIADFIQMRTKKILSLRPQFSRSESC